MKLNVESVRCGLRGMATESFFLPLPTGKCARVFRTWGSIAFPANFPEEVFADV